ncbi:MAG: hypothetical protein HC853_18825, partial [Anaerolineae bacterium]|nr:hypothetical protein [Anaerolineae bacterium]
MSFVNCTTTTYYQFGGQRMAVREQTDGLPSGMLYYLHSDHLGSASLTTDAQGKKVGELRYKPYGETRFTFGDLHTTKRWTGQRSESSSNIIEMGSRYYSPVLGRFLSADSIVPDLRNPQSLNRY